MDEGRCTRGMVPGYCQGPTHEETSVLTSVLTQNMPSFLIDQYTDEVSQDVSWNMTVLLNYGPVLLNIDPASRLIGIGI